MDPTDRSHPIASDSFLILRNIKASERCVFVCVLQCILRDLCMTLVLAKRMPLRSADFRIHTKHYILRSQAQRKTKYDFAECWIFWLWMFFFIRIWSSIFTIVGYASIHKCKASVHKCKVGLGPSMDSPIRFSQNIEARKRCVST